MKPAKSFFSLLAFRQAQKGSARLCLETLEPRFLLSADPLGAVIDLDLPDGQPDADQSLDDVAVFSTVVDDVDSLQVFDGPAGYSNYEPLDLAVLATSLTGSSQDEGFGGDTAPASVHGDAVPTSGFQEIFFVDSAVNDSEDLLAGLSESARDTRYLFVVLEQDGDPLQQISDVLDDYHHLDAIHLVTHGDNGGIRLGDRLISSQTLADHASQLAQWGDSLGESGDVLIYGCDVAASPDGKLFVDELAAIMDADVAASSDLTGAVSEQGDWNLEYQSGHIEAASLVDTEFSSWDGVLSTFVVNTTADTVDVNPGDGVAEDAAGNTSLRAAVMEANQLSGSDVIQLPAGTYVLSLGSDGENDAEEGDLDIVSNITISGAGAATTIIDGGGFDRIFELRNQAFLSLSDVTVENGFGDSRGGGILIENSDAELQADNIIVRNSVAKDGAGIYNKGTLNLSSSELSGNDSNGGSDSEGGGLWNDHVATLTDVAIENNSAGKGGGIYSQGASDDPLSFVGGSVTGNTAFGKDGGGIFLDGLGSIESVTIVGNTAQEEGGGIFFDGGVSLTLTDVTIDGNSALDGRGGGLFVKDKDAILERVIISGNDAYTQGGGIYSQTNDELSLTDVSVEGNTTVTGEGGGMYVIEIASLRDVTISGNTAQTHGGGIYIDSGDQVDLTNVTISGNTALTGRGGGLNNDEGEALLQNVTIAENSALTLGGGIYNDEDLTLRNTLIANNLSGLLALDVVGSFISDGSSIIENPGLAGGLLGDLTGIDPFLQPLADNGGFTQTHALALGSIAINSGVALGAPAVDQRGVAREGATDVGAYEYSSNAAPVLDNPISDQTATEDVLFSFTFDANTFSDSDGDTLTYTATLSGGGALPGWLDFDAATRTFSGTPLSGDVGTLDIEVTADDLKSGSPATDTFQLVVANANDDPTLDNPISDQNATEDALFSFTFDANTFGDEDGDALTYTATLSGGGALPGWLTFDAATRTFSGTPLNGDVGTLDIEVTADDLQGGTAATDTFQLIVANSNDDPALDNPINDQNATEDVLFSFTFDANTFGDVDGDALTYTATLSGGGALPGWLTFDAATRTFSGTPLNGDVGTLDIEVTADDLQGGAAATDTFQLIVANSNDDPTLDNPISDRIAVEDELFSFTFAADTFGDVDGDALTYTATLSGGGALPGWLTFDAATRTFSGTPLNGDIGTLDIDVTADDLQGGNAATDTFQLLVRNSNDDPTLDNPISDQEATEDAPFSFTFDANTFGDADGDALTYTATLSGGGALPGWLDFDAATRTFSGTPLSGDVGTLNIEVTADDLAGGSAASDTFQLVVTESNDDPTLNNPIGDRIAVQDVLFSFTFAADTFGDADGDALTYSANLSGGGALPGWLEFDAATRTFSGTPLNGDIGTLDIEVTADDLQGGSPATDTFQLLVRNSNDDPTLDNPIGDQDATEDVLFSFTFDADTFGDADGDALTYTATLSGGGALPGWLDFDAATRTFSGTPLNDDVGTLDIVVTADDFGGGSAATATFTIAVGNANDPVSGDVTITGILVEGEELTAVDSLADPDGLGEFSYEWQRSTNDGLSWATVGGGSKYTLTAEDVGAELRVQISYVDGRGTLESALSNRVMPTTANVPTGPIPVIETIVEIPDAPINEEDEPLESIDLEAERDPDADTDEPVTDQIGLGDGLRFGGGGPSDVAPHRGPDTYFDAELGQRFTLLGDTSDLSTLVVIPVSDRDPTQAADVSGSVLESFDSAFSSLAEVPLFFSSQGFSDGLDQMRQDAFDDLDRKQLVLGGSTALTAGLSVGYVAWLVRSGVLLGAAMGAMPMWRFIDPLPILSQGVKRDSDAEDEETLESMVTDQNDEDDEPSNLTGEEHDRT